MKTKEEIKKIITDRILKFELVKWKELIPLQPEDFKKISKKNFEKLKTSLIENNFLMTFIIWENSGSKFILDGLHRQKVLFKLTEENYTIPEKLPAIFLKCKNKQDAAKFILLHSSYYAEIQEESFFEFVNLSGLDLTKLKNEINLPEININGNINLEENPLKKKAELFSIKFDFDKKNFNFVNSILEKINTSYKGQKNYNNGLKLVKILKDSKDSVN